ncbi:MAG: glycosyltransferase family 2 protein [Candidatus Andersenbacteria bacterium]
MKLDIIIPTYNSQQVLPYVLEALANQEIPSHWQPRVVVSDDGSSQSPEKAVNEYEWGSPWRSPLVLCSKHAGPAAARNVGVSGSDADVLLLLGADIILRPGAVFHHCTFHDANPDALQAALGMIVWDPRLSPTPLVEWMTHGGPQNNFDDLLGVVEADPAHFFNGSHVSVKRSLLVEHPFPPEYTQYGWEDIDLGRILAARGLVLSVLHSARSLHRHAYTARDIRLRQGYAGMGAQTYARRYPDVHIFPEHSLRRYIKVRMYALPGIRWILWRLVAYMGRRYSLPRLFLLATSAGFWWGWYKGGGRRKSTEKAT